MRFAVRVTYGMALSLCCLSFAGRFALGADTILADWENNGTGSGGPGTDFDTAPIDGNPSCTGCWLKGNNVVQTTLTQSAIGVTSGSKSLQIAFVGKGAGGGSGLQDTHFDIGARVLWSSAASAQYPSGDPRFAALRSAITSGHQGLYTIELDVTYDIPSLRALDWLGPPVDYPSKPPQFIGLGLYSTSNGAGDPYTQVLEQVLPTLIDPFDTQWNGIQYLKRHVSIPLSQFGFVTTGAPTYYEMGFSLNGNWGTNPASTNTEAASYYVDDMVLHQFNPVAPIDFNNNGTADVGDWNLFMAQFLKTNPPTPPNPSTKFDLVGNFGAAGTNGKVDFADLQEFQRLYHLANPGAGALGAGTVPEPGTIALAFLGLIAWLHRASGDCGSRR
jgi:hypothetical protein